MKNYIFLFLLAQLITANISAQTGALWHGKKCAVVLTYDDALNVHIKNVLPALDSLGLKATFYISDYFDGLKDQIFQWRKAAANGHELGNHTLFHPCAGGPGREFVRSDYDLRYYSMKRITDEIKMANNLLTAIDGKTKRTFAYTCGDTKVGDYSIINIIRQLFVAARGVQQEMPPIDKVDLYQIGCYSGNGQSGEEMIDWVKRTMSNHTLLVFLFHGVGGEHSLNVSLEAHSQLLHFLKQNEKDIWIAPMLDVSEYIRNYQQKNKM